MSSDFGPTLHYGQPIPYLHSLATIQVQVQLSVLLNNRGLSTPHQSTPFTSGCAHWIMFAWGTAIRF